MLLDYFLHFIVYVLLKFANFIEEDWYLVGSQIQEFIGGIDFGLKFIEDCSLNSFDFFNQGFFMTHVGKLRVSELNLLLLLYFVCYTLYLLFHFHFDVVLSYMILRYHLFCCHSLSDLLNGRQLRLTDFDWLLALHDIIFHSLI